MLPHGFRGFSRGHLTVTHVLTVGQNTVGDGNVPIQQLRRESSHLSSMHIGPATPFNQILLRMHMKRARQQ